MKGSVKLPVFIDDARKYVNTTQLRAKYLGASYEAEYCQWQTLHGLGSLMETASLIITPNAYLEGKLIASYPPDPIGDFDVTRATTATRVNSAGLVELVPYNLVTYSQNFSNADWTNLNFTLTANNIANPINGQVDAFKVSLNSGTAVKLLLQSNTQNGTYTQSVYAKAGTHNFLQLLVGNDGSPYCNFDLVNGTYLAFGSTATITNVGDGWYRCTMTYTTTIGASAVYIWAVNSLSSPRADSTSSTGYFYAWGFQLVEGSTAKDYQKTETRLNIPRLDYSNGTCPSLLVEPQRTNLALYSSSFDNAAWTKINSTITSNTIVSPSGIQDADTLTSTSTIDENQVRFGTFSILGNVGSSYTTSVYVKKGSANYLRLRNLFVNNGGSDGNAWFDLTNGSVGTIQSSQTATIEDAGNGWWRCSLTGVVGSSSSFNFIDIGFADADNDYIPSTIINGYIWGAQLEAGNYSTSYIPTTSASVTRNADVISKTGISSLIGQTEGTVYADFVATGSGTHEILGVTLTGGGSEYIALFSTSNGNLYFASNVLGLVLIDTNSYNKRYKIAYSFESGSHILYSNGNVITTSTSGSVYSLLNAVYLGSSAVGSGIELLEANAVSLWKTRIENAQLAQLTTI